MLDFHEFEYICAGATASTMKFWGNFSPFSFNKFGLKSYQVELVDFDYCLNEGKSIKLSNEDTANFTHLQLHLYFETVERCRYYYFYVAVLSVSVTDSYRFT